MFKENVYTLEEVSDHLRIRPDAVEKEIASGRLRAARIQGETRIRESDLVSYEDEVFTQFSSSGVPGSKQAHTLRLSPASDFSFTWPDTKEEDFTDVQEGIVSNGGREHHVKLGFTFRESSGQGRRRCLVLVDRYASVEFVSADDRIGGRMASIIRNRDGKQVPIGMHSPPEYDSLPVGPYKEVVVGLGGA